MITTNSINFRSEPQQYSIFSNQNRNTKKPVSYEQATADILEFDKQAIKKQKRKDNLEKWGVIGTCTIGGALVGTLLLQIYTIAKGAKGGNAKVIWEDMTKKGNFPKLTDDCVNEKVRKFITNIKETTGLSDGVMKRAGVDTPEQCIIMWGPSGTGKTFSAKLLAKEIGAEYSEVQFADVSSPYIGQTSVEIKGIFKRLANKAKSNPNRKYLVAFNEIDALLVPREKCGSNNLHLAENRTAFLNGLDQIKEFKNIKIVGTTNVNPDSGNLDKASLSRFGNILKIDLPDKKEVLASLKFHMNKSEDVKNSKFFDNNKSKLDTFAKKLVNKRYAHRDIEDIAAKARRSYAIDLQAGKTKEFNIKYLQDAVETKGKPVGAIDDYMPVWLKENLDDPEFKNAVQQKTISFWQKLFGRNHS